MCIAVIKPKNVEMPSRKTLKNCFDSNPNGAGFMYSDGERLVIQKGYMTFIDFYTALTQANLRADQLVFLHFRIATHGLRDGGNTHPFPVTTDISELRSVKNTFDGYGLIHNGIIHYSPNLFKKYDPTDVISDTMLFSMILSECIDNMKNAEDKISVLNQYFYEENILSYRILTGDKTFDNKAEELLGYNKIAVMDANENYIYLGHWIHNNGMLYSNNDFEDVDYNSYYRGRGYYYSIADDDGYGNTQTQTISVFEPCCACHAYFKRKDMHKTCHGYCCNECKEKFELVKCNECNILFLPNDITDGMCTSCLQNDYRCDHCKKKATYLKSKKGKLYCAECYEQLFSSTCTALMVSKNK